MKQLVPLKKQSKKAQREHHAKQRGSWYGISPVTRTVPNGKTYDRNRVKRTNRELADCVRFTSPVQTDWYGLSTRDESAEERSAYADCYQKLCTARRVH